jgi:2-oxoglutarate ferredoxin oxidoreductase subunit gamma
MIATATDQSLVQVRICGYGGQGIVLAGMLLGKAASLYDGKEAVFTQSYGPEARGGASTADVVIATEPVDYPLVTKADVVVALFQEAYVRYSPTLRPGGILIVEEDLVQLNGYSGPVSRVPATRIAMELGARIATNIVVLGYLIGRTQVVSHEAMEQALRDTVKPKTLDMNLRALDAGFRCATEEVPIHA